MADFLGGATPVVTGMAGAFAVGLGGGLHCLMMCGPLACASAPREKDGAQWAGVGAYQGARVGAYALVGGLLGGVGGGVSAALEVSTHPSLPWVLAAGLVVSALDLGKRLRPLPGVRHLGAALVRAGAKFSPPARAAAIGAATPLLPCGLLYGLWAASLATASAWTGAGLMGAFALGGVPALLAAQAGASSWQRVGRWGGILRRGLPLLAAAVLVYRALSAAAGPEAPPCH